MGDTNVFAQLTRLRGQSRRGQDLEVMESSFSSSSVNS